MDNDSPTSRVERTLWTIWSYITGAVNRFFRPEPTNIITNDQDSFQESAVDSEPANCGKAEGDTIEREVDEEQSLATVCVIGSSKSVVAWELCTTDIDLGQDEESMQNKPQLIRGSEATSEKQFVHTGNDDGSLVAKLAQEDEQEESVQKSSTGGPDESPDNDEYEEHVNTRPLTGKAMSQDAEDSGEKAGAKEERTERTMTLDNHNKVDETMTKIHIKEEDDEKHHEDEESVESEDTEVQLCTITYLSQEEEEDAHIEVSQVQRDEADKAVMHEKSEDRDDVLLLVSENQNKFNDGATQAENELSVCGELSDDTDFKRDLSFTPLHDELQMSSDKCSIVSEDELIVVVGQDQVIPHRNESDEVEGEKEMMKDDEETLDEREQGAGIEEENVNETANNQTTDELQEQCIMSLREDSPEKERSTGFDTCGEEVMLNAKTESQTGKFTGGDQEDVFKDTELQTKATETDDIETERHSEVINGKSDMTTPHIRPWSVGERFLDYDQIEENEAGNKEGYMEEACTTSLMIKPEGETRQEISKGFKNIPLGICEGQPVVSLGLNSPTCEETQEGVPDYNNEPGPDENTAQRFLEVGDCEEIQIMQLPEEVESKESESLQNSSCSTGADCLLVREHMEEDRDGREDIKNSFDLVVEENVGILSFTDPGLPQETEKAFIEPGIQESTLLFEEKDGKLFSNTMKTDIEQKEFEMYVGSTDETDKTTEELQDGSEELLVELDEGLCDLRDADAAGDCCNTTGAVAAEETETLKVLEAELREDTDMSFFQESVDAINCETNSYKISSLLEDFNDSGFVKQSVETGEPKLLEDSIVEMQDAGIEKKETGFKVEEETELTTERNKEHSLTAESKLLDTQYQLPEEELKISSEEMLTDIEAPDASMITVLSVEDMIKHVTESEGSDAEESVSQISASQDVIDEEILDLWIQTALLEDTNDARQTEGTEAGQQTVMEIEPSSEERDEISPVQKEKDERLVESNLGESELVSDTEISSSTAESGFLDQSLCEWGAQNNETELQALISTGSFQGIHDILAKSADISEMSTQQPQELAEAQQRHLKEEESIIDTGFHPDLEVTSPEPRQLDQESDKSQEEDEETGSQEEVDAELTDLASKTDAEEADVKSQIETRALFKIDETEVEDEPLEITVSDSPDRIEHTESGRSRSGSDASLDEGIVSTESGSQGDPSTVSETKLLKLPSLDQPQPGWSEDIGGSLPALNRAEVAEQPTTESEDQMEVDTSALDFTAQRSRIAVKNPRVRPPKDPRSLLHMPSLDPTPSSHVPVKVPAGVPLGGMGIGIKLPGLGAGFPVLKKTQRGVRDENSPDTLSQEPATKPEEKSDTAKQDEAPRKPKWMPPRHPGFGNPLMSELKTKLKKPAEE